MTAGVVRLEIEQGEDWTTQIIVTDDWDEPINVIAPCRLDIKDNTGATLISLDSEVPPEGSGDIPGITVSSAIGMIQLHIEHTATSAMPPGQYGYDLFVTVDDGAAYAGNQIIRLIAGEALVSRRITEMTA